MRKIFTCLVLVMMVACGEEENKNMVLDDPGDVEISRVDIKVSKLFDNAEIAVDFTFNSMLPIGNLIHYGWIGVIEISDVDYPAACNTASYRDYTASVRVKNLLPGKYYARACAGNGKTGAFSAGITKTFEIPSN